MSIVEDAFGALVDQFKDPFAFIRELVQNALDAGSQTVDVDVHERGDLVSIEVTDTGDGMDRDIIENQLVRLFASSKDGDATKIGKFGIGFASVFSIRPEMVIVETARGAERWRVLFQPDGMWKLFVLDEAIEGTRVRVMKKASSPEERAQIREAAERTLRKWCRFADAEVTFAGKPVTEAFTVVSPIVVTVPLEAPGDSVVVGLATGEREWGFYNKGLTLLEGQGALDGVLPWVTFRARDGALEHTITRDNVIRDDAFHRVLEAVNDAARGPLLDAALAALEGSHPERDAICRALVAPAAEGALDKPAARLKQRVLRDVRGVGMPIAAARKAASRALLVRLQRPGALATALERSDYVVVRAGHDGDGALVEALTGTRALAHDVFVAIEPVTDKEQWNAAPLLASMRKLAAADGVITDVIAGRIDDVTGAFLEVPALVVADASRPIVRATALEMPKKKRREPVVLVMNLACPAVVDAVALSSVDVWLAAFLALRLALPSLPQKDGANALTALEQRCLTT